MSSAEITKYFDATEFREIREDLVFSVSKVSEVKIAIDCGCGADHLAHNGFTVYEFDRCSLTPQELGSEERGLNGKQFTLSSA